MVNQVRLWRFLSTERVMLAIVSLDQKRKPHPERAERLSTTKPPLNPDDVKQAQHLLRLAQRNPALRASIIKHAYDDKPK
jgi:hypothetical protein